MMPSDAPIGIFDSGIGGLSVLEHIQTLLPHENFIYISDRAHLPYGDKENDFILDRSQYIVSYLIAKKVKAIVIACNTATASAVKYLRENHSLPIIGMEPGVKPAIEQSRKGMIGVLATHGTLSSHKFKALLQQHANGTKVIICPCRGWVEAIEFHGHNSSITTELVTHQLRPILESGVDTLVLGCTHYPYLKRTIENLTGAGISIIDTGPAVAKQLFSRLKELDLLSTATSPSSIEFWCSAPPQETESMIERMLGRPVQVQSLPGRR